MHCADTFHLSIKKHFIKARISAQVLSASVVFVSFRVSKCRKVETPYVDLCSKSTYCFDTGNQKSIADKNRSGDMTRDDIMAQLYASGLPDDIADGLAGRIVGKGSTEITFQDLANLLTTDEYALTDLFDDMHGVPKRSTEMPSELQSIEVVPQRAQI